jgi:hypothetical protein
VVDRVFIHVGAPKTGTTYLQQALGQNRERLKDAGLLYPKSSADAHHTAAWDLRELWEQRENPESLRGVWDRTVRKVMRWDGPSALLSSELFVYADRRQASRALTSFGEAEVHVVYTARDLVRQLPAVWQERLKNQRVMPYQAFVDDVIGPSKTGMAKGFWSAQDAPTALQRWSKGLPAEQVHVVTMPPSGSSPGLLWDRFMTVLGLDGADFDVEVPAVNTSMGAVEAEVLRRINQRHAQAIGPAAYRKLVRERLFDLLDDVVSDKVPITLTPDEHRALVARGKQLAAELAQAGYDVAGDLHDLVPAPLSNRSAPADRRRPDDVTQAEVTDALVDVVWALLEERRAAVEARRARKRGPGKRRRQSRGGEPTVDADSDVEPDSD